MRCFGMCVIVIFVFCAGCASYKPLPLSYLHPEFSPFSQDIGGTVVSTKKFDKSDCKKYFDRDLIGKGFQPVQLTIANETKRYLLFSPQCISLPTVPAEEVARKAHTSTAGRATAYGVGALFLWPLLVPAIVDGVGSSKANKRADSDFSAKGITQTVIQPYSTENKVIFIATPDYQDSFDIILVDRETTEKLTYRVKGI